MTRFISGSVIIPSQKSVYLQLLCLSVTVTSLVALCSRVDQVPLSSLIHIQIAILNYSTSPVQLSAKQKERPGGTPIAVSAPLIGNNCVSCNVQMWWRDDSKLNINSPRQCQLSVRNSCKIHSLSENKKSHFTPLQKAVRRAAKIKSLNLLC